MDLTTIETDLLATVRNYLNITWIDEATDNNLIGYIRRGMARLQEVAGVSLDFSIESSARSLLLDYCRYANSQALEMFEKNFSSELLELNLSNQFENIEELYVISAPGTMGSTVIVSVSPTLEDDNSYFYKTGSNLSLPKYLSICDAVRGFTAWDGKSEITKDTGIMIIEVDSNYKALKAGIVNVG
jgi:hypothetical protein